MLCPCRTSTPRAPHQPSARGALLCPRTTTTLTLSPRTKGEKEASSSSSSSARLALPSRARRRPALVPVAAAPPAQDGFARGDGLITSAAAAGGAATSPAPAPSPPSPPEAQQQQPSPPSPPAAQQQQQLSPPPLVAPTDLLVEYEHKLQGDLKAVGVTIVAVTGVIVYWRGVWSLLDHLLGDSVAGDLSCVVMGLLTVLGVRLSGAKMSSFWPTS